MEATSDENVDTSTTDNPIKGDSTKGTSAAGKSVKSPTLPENYQLAVSHLVNRYKNRTESPAVPTSQNRKQIQAPEDVNIPYEELEPPAIAHLQPVYDLIEAYSASLASLEDQQMQIKRSTLPESAKKDGIFVVIEQKQRLLKQIYVLADKFVDMEEDIKRDEMEEDSEDPEDGEESLQKEINGLKMAFGYCKARLSSLEDRIQGPKKAQWAGMGIDSEVTDPFTAEYETLLAIHSLAETCRYMLRWINSQREYSTVSSNEASKQMTSFNIWADAIALNDSFEAMAVRLRFAYRPTIQMKQLLQSLKESLETHMLFYLEESDDDVTDSESDNDDLPENSEIPYRIVQEPGKSELPCSRGLWIPIHNKITSLRQLTSRIKTARATHMTPENNVSIKMYHKTPTFESMKAEGLHKASTLFPNAEPWLHERAAQSIAIRRMRRVHLVHCQDQENQHKTPKMALPVRLRSPQRSKSPPGKGKQIAGVPAPPTTTKDDTTTDNTQSANDTQSANETSELPLSASLETPMRENTLGSLSRAPEKPADQSAKEIDFDIKRFPLPPLNEDGTGFDCVFCKTTCPASERSTPKLWIKHLLEDFTPFFCVVEGCNDPFQDSASYGAWLAHVQTKHTVQEWYCWYCQSDPERERFESAQALEEHLAESHADRVSEALRPTVVRHSVRTEEPGLDNCPFCNVYPEDIGVEFPDYASYQAIDALNKHVRNHLIELSLRAI